MKSINYNTCILCSFKARYLKPTQDNENKQKTQENCKMVNEKFTSWRNQLSPQKRCGHIGKQWNLNNVYSITMNNQNSSYDDDNDAYIKKNNLKKEFL